MFRKVRKITGTNIYHGIDELIVYSKIITDHAHITEEFAETFKELSTSKNNDHKVLRLRPK